MEDYAKRTVSDLRQILKERGIPSTGLTRKQQIIDRLVAEDAAEQNRESGIPFDQESEESEGQGQGPASTSVDGTAVPKAHEKVEDLATPIDASSSNGRLSPRMDDSGFEQRAEPSEPTPNKSIPITSEKVEGSPMRSPSPVAGQKRKSRSQTPSDDEQSVFAKKQRIAEVDGQPGVSPEEDEHVNIPDSRNMEATPEQVLPLTTQRSGGNLDEPEDTLEESKARNNAHGQNLQGAMDAHLSDAREVGSTHQAHLRHDAEDDTPSTVHDSQSNEHTGSRFGESRMLQRKDSRFRELVTKPADTPDDLYGNTEDRIVAPAHHSATSAIYIRDIMRPLHVETLRDHLTSVARKTDGSEEVLVDFFVDAIRSHCFAVFNSVSAASRVRTALHNRVWPAEKTRKPLWVDFVPEDKVREWIQLEQDNSLARDAGTVNRNKRWEVNYQTSTDGEVSASLQEAGVTSRSMGGSERPQPARTATDRSSQMRQDKTASSFVALDQLFKFTAAKPKLYFQPVSSEAASRRLAKLDIETSRRNPIPPGGSGYPDSMRYSFEDVDEIVDNGPEFGLRPPRGVDSYRGRGGYGGPPSRTLPTRGPR